MAATSARITLSDAITLRIHPGFSEDLIPLPIDLCAELEFPLPKELWIKFAVEAVHDPALSPEQSARVRGILASLSKGWHAGVSTLSELWSYIPIYTDTSLERIRFYLARCATGGLDIVVSLRDVTRIHEMRGTKENIAKAVDTIFDLIAPTASRWRSFRLITENPFVFAQVQFRCSQLRADSLETIELIYVYMPGYSMFVGSLADFERPFQTFTWFSGRFPSVRRVTVSCTALQWDTIGMYDNLEILELSDYSRAAELDIDVLPTLFRRARKLRALKIGNIRPIKIVTGTIFRTTSLRILDVYFAQVDWIDRFFGALDAPNLTDLTIREVYDCLDVILIHPSVLARITRFTVIGDVGDVITLHLLFTSLSSLNVLDLTHTLAHVFESYCDWACSRPRFFEPNLAVNLRALYLGRFNINTLLTLVTFVMRSMPDNSGRAGIDIVRIDSPSPPSFSLDTIEHLRQLVPDFSLTNKWLHDGNQSHLGGRTFHSLFARLGYYYMEFD